VKRAVNETLRDTSGTRSGARDVSENSFMLFPIFIVLDVRSRAAR